MVRRRKNETQTTIQCSLVSRRVPLSGSSQPAAVQDSGVGRWFSKYRYVDCLISVKWNWTESTFWENEVEWGIYIFKNRYSIFFFFISPSSLFHHHHHTSSCNFALTVCPSLVVGKGWKTLPTLISPSSLFTSDSVRLQLLLTLRDSLDFFAWHSLFFHPRPYYDSGQRMPDLSTAKFKTTTDWHSIPSRKILLIIDVGRKSEREMKDDVNVEITLPGSEQK